MNCISESTVFRLTVGLIVPAVSIAVDGHSDFFTLLTVTNLLGVICGVTLYRSRLNKEGSVGPSFTQSAGLAEHLELMREPFPSATSTPLGTHTAFEISRRSRKA
jgi:hypothetical protein